MSSAPAFVCISSYFKGNDFLRSLKRSGAVVYLVTSKKLDSKPWAREALDDIFYVQQDADNEWHMPDVISGLAWLMRTRRIDRIVALDDFDVEKGAHLREYFRLPGMGESTCRYFRDKLAMRVQAAEQGLNVPGFTALFNDEAVNHFAANTPTPWIVKPRGQASATGMKKIYSAEELWAHIETLGDRRHQYLVEQFIPGDVYHLDSLSLNGEVIFSCASQYLATPFEVAHGGGIFRSAVLPFGSEDEHKLFEFNASVKKGFGMIHGASHTEFIKGHADGKFYFLETSARVGGAHIADLVEAATGVNVWAEWARIEYAIATNQSYTLPPQHRHYAGIIISLTRQEWPDLNAFQDPEIVWRMTDLSHHIGLIVRASKRERVLELLDSYAERVNRDFHASAPPPAKPNL